MNLGQKYKFISRPIVHVHVPKVLFVNVSPGKKYKSLLSGHKVCVGKWAKSVSMKCAKSTSF